MKTVRTPNLFTKAGWAWHATIYLVLFLIFSDRMGSHKHKKDKKRSRSKTRSRSKSPKRSKTKENEGHRSRISVHENMQRLRVDANAVKYRVLKEIGDKQSKESDQELLKKCQTLLQGGGGQSEPIKIGLNLGRISTIFRHGSYGLDSSNDIPFLCPSKNIAVNKILIKLCLLPHLIRLV